MSREEMVRRMKEAALLLEPIAAMKKEATSSSLTAMIAGCQKMVHALTVGAFAVDTGAWDDEITMPNLEANSETRS